MRVNLIQHSNLSTCVRAVRTCWDSHDKGGCYTEPTDNISDSDKKLLSRVILKHKHGSTAEHLVYTFDIDGISRACLQELARHRIASLSVESTRYTLKRLKHTYFTIPKDKDSEEWETIADHVVLTGNLITDTYIARALKNLCDDIQQSSGTSDTLKYQLPEAFKTSLVWTINARSLQNFLELRSSKHALWEIRELATAIYEALPDEHKYLFKDYVNEL